MPGQGPVYRRVGGAQCASVTAASWRAAIRSRGPRFKHRPVEARSRPTPKRQSGEVMWSHNRDACPRKCPVHYPSRPNWTRRQSTDPNWHAIKPASSQSCLPCFPKPLVVGSSPSWDLPASLKPEPTGIPDHESLIHLAATGELNQGLTEVPPHRAVTQPSTRASQSAGRRGER